MNEPSDTVCPKRHRMDHNCQLLNFLEYLLEACCTDVYRPTKQKFTTHLLGNFDVKESSVRNGSLEAMKKCEVVSKHSLV